MQTDSRGGDSGSGEEVKRMTVTGKPAGVPSSPLSCHSLLFLDRLCMAGDLFAWACVFTCGVGAVFHGMPVLVVLMLFV